MNKVFLGLILAVCVLGMALVLLNERLGRKPEARPSQPVAEAPASAPLRSPAEISATARALEIAGMTKEKDEAESISPEVVAPSPIPASQPKIAPVAPARPEPPAVPKSMPEPVRIPAALPKSEIVKPDSAPAPQIKAEAPKPAPGKPEPVKVETPKTEPAKAAASAGAPKIANRFVIYAREKGATVRIGGASKMEYSSITLEDPDRVVVDLNGDWKFPAAPGVPKNDLVSAVRVGKNGDKTRLVIDLKGKPRKVNLVPFKGGDGVDVRVDK